MNRNARWVWIVAATAVLGGGLVLAFVMSLTSETAGFYERNFVWLFWLNLAVGTLLVLVIGVALARLAMRLRRGKFGTRLLTKLAGIFALVGLLPGLVIYTVSYQFVSRSIEIWFDVKVATALDAGLALGKGGLESLVLDLGNETQQAAGAWVTQASAGDAVDAGAAARTARAERAGAAGCQRAGAGQHGRQRHGHDTRPPQRGGLCARRAARAWSVRSKAWTRKCPAAGARSTPGCGRWRRCPT